MYFGDVFVLEVEDEVGVVYVVYVCFVLDVSGFGCVLLCLLNFEVLICMLMCVVFFMYVCDVLFVGSIDCDKICIVVYLEWCDVWYWMILLVNGCFLVGCVVEVSFFDVLEVECEVILCKLIWVEFNIVVLIGDVLFFMFVC